MRIIAGEKKGFALKSPKGLSTRPTLSRVRESLFGILQHEIPGAYVLDLFAGAGSLGLEALSRGAQSCTFVERTEAALIALKSNIEKLNYGDKAHVVRAEVIKWLQMQKTTGWPLFNIVFCDPPYDTGLASSSLQHIALHLPLHVGATVVIQSSPREQMPDHSERLRRYRTQKYGDTVLHFYICCETQ
ncbi:MAG: 16S rRNA (guanine(966)-N(2))-methyltransferase RsmD [Candidatus Sumerlaeaceae bacterium]|nr:16S rRNA (guanine(966)-N(2))-methyltransferase RsmD [Candidatus Sumerlaeaceae bacterium]